MVSDELAVQVKRHRDKRRKRRESRAASASQASSDTPAVPGSSQLPGDVSPAA
jgi:putative sigma-54 modulation protein